MGAEILLICPCPGHFPGRFSGAVEKVSEGFSLGDRAWPDAGHGLGKASQTNTLSGQLGQLLGDFICFGVFWHTSQLFAQPQRILTQTAEIVV